MWIDSWYCKFFNKFVGILSFFDGNFWLFSPWCFLFKTCSWWVIIRCIILETGQESTNEIWDRNKIEKQRETQKDRRDKYWQRETEKWQISKFCFSLSFFFVTGYFLCLSLSLNSISVSNYICTFLPRRFTISRSLLISKIKGKCKKSAISPRQ